MAKSKTEAEHPTLPTHGASSLPSVEIDSYNLAIEDEAGFVGDKASKGAFRELLESVRNTMREAGVDPLGAKASDKISKKELDALLATGGAEAGAVVQGAVEKFAGQLAAVISRFLRQKTWRDTECIVVGGGMSASRVGELAIARAGILLKEAGTDIDISPIHNDPDEAGLIGAVHLLPPWMVKGHDALLAVDVGGTKIRAGIVELNLGKAKDLSRARAFDISVWCHRDEEKVDRDDAVERLTGMLRKLAKDSARSKLRLAPVIGVGCPGVICEDGSIKAGAQNLPGNWQSSRFNLPRILREEVSRIGEHETMVVMHNDAVVQGLSELPYIEAKRWAVLTIGTGLGNARFSMRSKKKPKD
jgi:predicted NBD/HSP70 family sugar kinase